MTVKRSHRFPETTASVPVARQFVAESLSALAPEVAEMAALLVSELATNAVVHATSYFAVNVLYPTATVRVRVEVVDGVPGEPMPLRPPAAAAAASAAANALGVRRPRARLFRRRRRGLSFLSVLARRTRSTSGAPRYPKRMLACSTPSHQL